jgi:hypothetical protein
LRIWNCVLRLALYPFIVCWVWVTTFVAHVAVSAWLSSTIAPPVVTFSRLALAVLSTSSTTIGILVTPGAEFDMA